MAVLSHPVGWRRTAKRDVDADLNPTEQTNVRKALRFLVKRYGSWSKLAGAMGSKSGRIENAASRGAVTAGLALRAARVAGQPLERLLDGSWPTATMCPHCGRG